MSSQSQVLASTSSKRGRGTLSVGARVVFELLTIAALLVPVYWIASHWSQLPVIVPEHYDLMGGVDRTGLKSHLWFFPAAALVLYVLLGVASFLPQYFNLPVSWGNPGRVRMEHLGIELMLTLRLELVLLFGLVAVGATYSAQTGHMAFNFWFSLGAAAVVIGTLVLFTLEMFLIGRPRQSTNR